MKDCIIDLAYQWLGMALLFTASLLHGMTLLYSTNSTVVKISVPEHLVQLISMAPLDLMRS